MIETMADDLSKSSRDMLAHREFVLRLATALVPRGADAEDVAQEAWLAAVRNPPRGESAPAVRSWLKRVVQNAARQHHRGAGRRRAREEATARAEALADSTRSVERLEFHEALVQRVLRLPEPLRTTVVLRYLEDRSTDEVARRMGVPVSTVRARQRRALATLRKELDEAAGGDRASWITALLPAVHVPGGAGKAAVGLTGTWIGMKLGIALALGLLATLWFLRSEYSDDSTEHAGVTDVDAPTMVGSSAVPGPSDASGGAARESVATSVDPVPVSVPDSTPIEAEAAFEVEGTVEVVGPDGTIDGSSDGHLVLGFLRDQEGLRIEVIAGAFRARWDGPRRLVVRGAVLGGAGATTSEPQSIGAGDSPAKIRLYRSPGWTLHVLDADTHEALRSVEVLSVDGWEAGVFRPSGDLPSTSLARDVDSPVELEAGLGRRPYWVRADGYAWKRAWVDHVTEREATVLLEAAATLRVWCRPDDLSPRIRVRLYPGGFEGDDPMYTALPIAHGEPSVFRDVRAGAYQVRAEVGEFFDPPVRFAVAETSVRSGETVDVHLELDEALVGPPPAPLAGTLVLPAGLAERRGALELMRAVGPAIRPGDRARVALHELVPLETPGEYAFDFDRVTPGRVKLGLYPQRYSWVVDLPESGDRDVVLRAGRLAEVEVEVRDELTGALLAVEGVAWSPWPGGLWDEEAPPGSIAERALDGFEVSYPDPETRITRFVAPEGTLHLGFWLDGYGEDGEEVQVVADRTNRITLTLAPVATLLVGYVDAAGELLDIGGRLELERVGEPAEWERVRTENGRRVVTLQEGGVWRISAVPEGWVLVGPAEISIQPGERRVLDAVLAPE